MCAPYRATAPLLIHHDAPSSHTIASLPACDTSTHLPNRAVRHIISENHTAFSDLAEQRLGVLNPDARSKTAEYLSPRKFASLITRTIFNSGPSQPLQQDTMPPFVEDM